eukprot:6461953-Amphidinium_carterae.1
MHSVERVVATSMQLFSSIPPELRGPLTPADVKAEFERVLCSYDSLRAKDGSGNPASRVYTELPVARILPWE